MPAIVRVKRRIDEEPQSAFVLNGKKRRLDNGMPLGVAPGSESNDATEGKDEVSTVLKFAGTLHEQDNTATTQFAARLKKDEAKKLVLEKSSQRGQQMSATERTRQEIRQSQQEQRFRVVNCQRTTINEATEEASELQLNATNSAGSNITIVDIEQANAQPVQVQQQQEEEQQQQQQQQQQQPADSDTGYVYDLYLPENEQQAAYVDLMDDNYLRLVIHLEEFMVATYLI